MCPKFCSHSAITSRKEGCDSMQQWWTRVSSSARLKSEIFCHTWIATEPCHSSRFFFYFLRMEFSCSCQLVGLSPLLVVLR
ncbi:hypothetical protein MPTK1_7g11490 [Marchantia polymorpha subsp. ruderalis]|uniref:Uncharacterized protein n=2 Tax=Marchantia polymorpha TaxID=3197 RepID=A0AAF6BYF7_MARPO|nr:hypothetical protein MARPO_0003s0163 [Marchantia polymorpha]BBN17041.1 hypothetical protein Mp_7g11490 [Marchantia polymorpha subsp. ruderalis]|eukprot:PTQ49278.1 hypothetical protein MARPO_0003s0163 [Marchantia polymorpha]